MNDFYTPTGSPATSSQAASSTMRNEFNAIEDGFDKLASLSGNSELPIFVNTGETGLEAVSASTAISRLGLDADIATLSLPASTTITAFTKTILDDADAAAVIATLGLDADLATLSLPANTTISAFGATLIDDADAAAQRTTLGLVIGTDVLAQQTIGIANDNLVEIDDADAAVSDYAKFTAAGLEGRSYAEVKQDLDLEIGTDIHAFNAVLDDLSALAVVADNEFIVGTGAGTYAHESGATARTSMGAAASGANSDITSLAGLTTALSLAQGGSGAAGADWADYSATSTVVGWSSFTVKLIYTKKIGNTVFVSVDIRGTSNSTATTITLPYTSTNDVYRRYSCYRLNNGVPELGMTQIPPNTSTVAFFANMASTAWTASGDKVIIATFVFEAQ